MIACLSPLQVLRNYKGTAWASGSSVILLTDGQNGGGIDPLSLIHVANSAGITFHTIGYSEAADPNLEKIAKETGGQSYYSRGSASSAAVFDAMSSIADVSEGGSPETTRSTPVSVS
jgi:hypothetical protein